MKERARGGGKEGGRERKRDLFIFIALDLALKLGFLVLVKFQPKFWKHNPKYKNICA